MIESIKSPRDIKDLSYDELGFLCSEIRKKIIKTVSENGGHLASNLGMVEATVALHRVFDSPKDKIIFDVSHQCYTHKLLTGRYNSFSTLRQFGGMSGFACRDESEHDILSEGHSGSSVSAALGVATANKLRGNTDHTIAVVGDGALTNGMIYEALNNCGDKKLNLIILINDNKMSISQNVGGLHRYLNRIRTSNGYFTFKRRFEYYLSAIPVVGSSIARILKLSKDAIKRMFVKDTIFEDLGLVYLGPVDGHNIEKLSRVLNEAKNKHQCCVVHMVTKKGNGYSPAENEPSRYHGVGHFDAEYGLDPDFTGESFSTKMGEILCRIAEEDKAVCAVTAAMCDGTGLGEFADKFPDRFFDVGIAEEHAVTFAGGLSVSGMKPVVALYSTFAQRVYDQIQHDIAVQGLPLTVVLDRCGLVAGDGITHQGIFDYQIFSSVPDTVIYSPATYGELEALLRDTLSKNDGITFIRYPKGKESASPSFTRLIQNDDGSFAYTDNVQSADAVIITYGRLTEAAFDVMGNLSGKCNVGVIKLLRVYPLNFDDLSPLVSNCKMVYILDEGYRSGGVGEKLSAGLETNKKIVVNAVDGFIRHGLMTDLMEASGFTANQITDDIIRQLN